MTYWIFFPLIFCINPGHVLELQRRHAEKKRASVLQRFQSQMEEPMAQDRSSEEPKPLGSDIPRASAFSKLSSDSSTDSKVGLITSIKGSNLASKHQCLDHSNSPKSCHCCLVSCPTCFSSSNKEGRLLSTVISACLLLKIYDGL